MLWAQVLAEAFEALIASCSSIFSRSATSTSLRTEPSRKALSPCFGAWSGPSTGHGRRPARFRMIVAEVAFDDDAFLGVLGIVLQEVVQLLQPEMRHRSIDVMRQVVLEAEREDGIANEWIDDVDARIRVAAAVGVTSGGPSGA